VIRDWQNKLASIPLAGASLVDLDDAKLLRAQLIGYERWFLVYKTYEKFPSGQSLAILGAIYTQFLPTRDRILSTAAHEAMPGHFLQLSMARRRRFIARVLRSPVLLRLVTYFRHGSRTSRGPRQIARRGSR
jgi:hypothetical protein